MATPGKDYYRILQVDPAAEAEVIEAAYHRLMNKYHPDKLSARRRRDPANENRVRDINEAYACLKDKRRRAEYDRLRPLGAAPAPAAPVETADPPPGFEGQVLQVKCGSRKQTFKMLLVRRAGVGERWRVAGFETPSVAPAKVARLALPTLAPAQLLEAPQAMASGFTEWVRHFFRPRPSGPAGKESHFPAWKEIESIFTPNETPLRLADIDLNNLHCPLCGSSGWVVCGRCNRLQCLGRNWRSDGFGCVWCGCRNHYSRDASETVRPSLDGHQAYKPAAPAVKKPVRPKPALPREDQKRLPPPKRSK